MTPDEIKTAITGWCNQATGLQLVEDRSEPGADIVLAIRSSAHGAASVPVDVLLEQGGDRLTARSTSSSAADATTVEALLASRPATVRGEASTDGTGGTVISAHAYIDGFSEHVFIATVDEVAKTRALVDALAGAGATAGSDAAADDAPAADATATVSPREQWAAAAPQADPWSSPATPEPSTPSPSPQADPWSPSPQPAQAAASLPAPTFASPSPSASPTPTASPSPAQAGGYTPPSGQAAPQAQPVAAAFAPTHTVPPQGMQAWAAPDPNGAIVATLGGGLPIQITEVRGAWARVLCSNGWAGWVDGRIIGVAR